MEQNVKQTSERRAKFNDKYNDFDEVGILKEILFAQALQIDKLEKLRSNTSTLVWWLVAIPIICFILILFFGGFGNFFT